MEIVGYAFRILSSQQNPYSVIWFVVQVWPSIFLEFKIGSRMIWLTENLKVLLHRRRTRLLLGGNLLARFRHDHHLRARIRADAAEARPLDLHRVRRRGDDRSDCRRGFGRSGVFQPRGPDDAEQHSLSGARLPGVLVCRLPDRIVLDFGQG